MLVNLYSVSIYEKKVVATQVPQTPSVSWDGNGGLLVQIVDVLKGVLAVAVIAPWLDNGIIVGSGEWFQHSTAVQMIAGISAIIGHIWSVFVGFKGGKGINTFAGMLIGLAPIDVGIALGVFGLAVIFSGYISLGSISGVIALPSSLVFRYNIFGVDIPGYHVLVIFTSIAAALLIFTHRSNILRLIKGTENRFAKLQLVKISFRNRNNS